MLLSERRACIHQHLIPARLYGVFESVGASQMPDLKFERLHMRTRFAAALAGWDPDKGGNRERTETEWLELVLG